MTLGRDYVAGDLREAERQRDMAPAHSRFKVNTITVSRRAGQRTMTLRKPTDSPECHTVSPVIRQPKP